MNKHSYDYYLLLLLRYRLDDRGLRSGVNTDSKGLIKKPTSIRVSSLAAVSLLGNGYHTATNHNLGGNDYSDPLARTIVTQLCYAVPIS